MFKEIKANKSSLARRRPVYGVGINDAVYTVQPRVNGKHIICPFYRKWQDMLRRCYSDKLQQIYPTYKGCSVFNGWLTFSNFKAWMQSNNWQERELDKDLLIKGNKYYSPDTCLFVPQSLNSLLIDSAASRGKYPQGVCFHKINNKYQAELSINGVRTHIGLFDTPEQASQAYKKAKSKHINEVAQDYKTEPRLYKALLQYVEY